MVKRLIAGAFVLCMSMSLFSAPCLSGAWTMQKGKVYDRLALGYYYSEEEFDKDGSREDFAAGGKFRDANLSNYVEYGIMDNLTFINSIVYKRIEKEEEFRETSTYGLGDIDLGLKYKLADGAAGVLSAQGMVKVPEAYDEDKRLPLGNGQYDGEIRLLYGRSLWEILPGYCGIEIGYRWRDEGPSDEFRYLVELGMDFTKALYGRVKLDGIKSMDNGEKRDGSGNPTTSNNFDLGKLDIVLGGKINPNWGVEFGYTPSIYGENTAAGATYSAALTWQM